MKLFTALCKRLLHLVAVVFLVAVGSSALIHFAPGYLSDERELDVRYARTARSQIAAESQRTASLPQWLVSQCKGLAHGDFGISRQYEIPVSELLGPQITFTLRLLFGSITLSWMLAASAALILTARRDTSLFWQLPIAVLLAVPVAAMVTICILAETGGPLLVMTLLLAARDFKFIERLLVHAWRATHLLQARAQGLRFRTLLWIHIVPNIVPQIFALTTLSIVTALSAVVPVEVIFGVPGIGHTAWTAAMNRDLPVLFVVTMFMGIAVAVAGIAADKTAAWTASWTAA